MKKDAAGTKPSMRSIADIARGSADPRPEELPDAEMQTTPEQDVADLGLLPTVGDRVHAIERRI